jgi:prepilin-type processing-associated H-X9-DG protein/prepilin-type N-terminal cleavage/methylation domain-containing protein
MRSRGTFRCGFTLVELLVLLAVLGVLAGILMPTFSEARERARRADCLSRVRQIALAHLMYAQNWDERFPDWRFPNSPSMRAPERVVYWTTLLQPYLRSTAILHDPTVPIPPHGTVDLATYALLTLGPGGTGTWESPYWQFPGPRMTLALVVRPAETISVSDGVTNEGANVANPLRHRGGANVAFLDGHARWMRFAQRTQRLDDGRGFYWLRFYTADR